MRRLAPPSPRFPYTALFRSRTTAAHTELTFASKPAITAGGFQPLATAGVGVVIELPAGGAGEGPEPHKDRAAGWQVAHRRRGIGPFAGVVDVARGVAGRADV